MTPFPEPGMQNTEPETWGVHKSLAGVGGGCLTAFLAQS